MRHGLEAAIHRRLYEELGLRCPLQFLFKFQYQAQFDAAGAEQELCSVFIGGSASTVALLALRLKSPIRGDRTGRYAARDVSKDLVAARHPVDAAAGDPGRRVLTRGEAHLLRADAAGAGSG